jgi:predicted AAA+ superfamily ATPase
LIIDHKEGFPVKRLINYDLKQWVKSDFRKPLIIRGARQIGKTYAARMLGESFESYAELNFERSPEAREIFKKDLDPERIVRDLSLFLGKSIVAGKTLMFLDEIQTAPEVLTALRYFYEEMPALHVIAAGSLLDFAIEKLGVPVGRVTFLYMYPLSFIEFILAMGKDLLAKEIIHLSNQGEINSVIHEKLLLHLGEYMAVGGMPEAIKCWRSSQDLAQCSKVHHLLVDSYREDFTKYARESQLKYVELLFSQAPLELGKKFKYTNIPGEYRKRELAPCLDLLFKAGVLHRIVRSAGNGVPLGGEASPEKFKLLFLDIALAQAMLGLDLKNWILNFKKEIVNKGAIAEALVGQEILAYSNPSIRQDLYYWDREKRSSQAELDYLIQEKGSVIPLEVKSGHGKHLKSLKLFLEQRPKSPYGLRLSLDVYSKKEGLHSYPLYAVASVVSDDRLKAIFD